MSATPITQHAHSLAHFRRLASSHWRRAILFAAWALVAAPSVAANLSGSYFGRGERFVVLLEFAQTDGGQVVGRLRQTAIDARGALHEFDAPLSGAVNGDQFVGKLERSWIQRGGGAISGQLTGDLFKLSGANGLRAQLRRGRESDYSEVVAALAREGAQVGEATAAYEQRRRAEHALGDVASRIQRLVKQAADFAAQEPRIAQKSATASQTYADISSRMSEMLLRLRATTGRSADGIAQRSSLAASMLHASIEAEHAHIEVSQAQNGFESAASKLSNGLADATKACGEAVPDTLSVDTLRQACGLVPGRVRELNRVIQEVRLVYGGDGAAWQQERPRHAAMLREAEAFKRQYDHRAGV